MMSSRDLKRNVSLLPAGAVVVANMLGAGIFTTTGFLVSALGEPLVIYGIWLLGGLLALSGALCFAELGAAMPKAGGEYIYLRKAFGGSFAFMSFVVSLSAGFPAPVASALKSLGVYLGFFFPVLAIDDASSWISPNDFFAIVVCWALVFLHFSKNSVGLGITTLFTFLKVAGVVVLLLAGFLWGSGDWSGVSRGISPPIPTTQSPLELGGALASSLVFVMFCYSGWNGASYLAGEMKNPARDIPRALLAGTGLVVVLYLGLNLLYFYGAPASELASRIDVAVIAARGLFGMVGAAAVTVLLSISLLAASAAMTALGPRVYYAVGKDFAPLSPLSRTDESTGSPRVALILQGSVTSVFILLGRVDQIQQYAGFTLSLFSTFAVVSVIVLRRRCPDLPRPFRAWGYPWPPLLFIAVATTMMVFALVSRPVESLLGVTTIALGGLAHFVVVRRARS